MDERESKLRDELNELKKYEETERNQLIVSKFWIFLRLLIFYRNAN